MSEVPEVREVAAPDPERSRRRPGINVIPQRVRRAREEAGMTLAELAEGKLSRTAIHLIEAGRSRPSEATLAHISERTGKPIAYFLGRDAGTQQVMPEENARRAADLLRQASWSMNGLLRHGELTVTERLALEAMLLSIRRGILFLAALRDRQ